MGDSGHLEVRSRTNNEMQLGVFLETTPHSSMPIFLIQLGSSQSQARQATYEGSCLRIVIYFYITAGVAQIQFYSETDNRSVHCVRGVAVR